MRNLTTVLFLLCVVALSAPIGHAFAQADEASPIRAKRALTVTLELDSGNQIEVPLMLDLVVASGTLSVTATVSNTEGVSATVSVEPPVSAHADSVVVPPLAGPILATANRNANLRTGPGTDHLVSGSVAGGDYVVVKGQLAGGEWLLLDSGDWIASFLVDGNVTNVPLVEPTPTPIPTSTPLPTLTPTIAPAAALSAVDSAYILEAVMAVANYQAPLEKFSNQMLKAGDNPFLLFDEDWILDTAIAIAGVQYVGESIRELQPPPCCTEAHQELLTAVQHFDKAMDYATDGIDSVDADLIMLGTTEMSLAGDALEAAAALLESLSVID